MPTLARQGDPTTHGGMVLTAASRTLVEGKPVARMGDLVLCGKHGPQPIVLGLSTVFVEGKPVARVGDIAACGARILAGSTRTQSG
ncbi:MAG: PAAR domain-containing protein [Armatimonadota bacterium]